MNIVIYARYSSHNQNYQSIEGQLKECREYAIRNGYNIIYEYIDEAKSGTKDDRAQFLRMIEDSKKRQFKVVLVYQLDRFARNKYDSAIYKKQLKDRGIRVLSAKENITDDPAGKMLESVLEGMAEYYSDELSLKVKRGMSINAENGFYSGGTITFGYSTEEFDSKFTDVNGNPIKKKRYVIDSVNGRYVTQSFTDIKNGMKPYEVIEKLKQQGAKTSKGNYFNQNSLYRMLRNKMYLGIIESNGKEIKGIVPSLVDEETFNIVQKMFRKNKRGLIRNTAQDEYLLATKLFCGYCKNFMVGTGGTSKSGKVHHYYTCKGKKAKCCDKKSIKKKLIEKIVIDEAVHQLTNENIDIITSTTIKLAKTESETSSLKQLTRSLKTIDKKRSNLINAVAECDDINLRRSFYDRLSEVEKQKQMLELEISEEEANKNYLTVKGIKFFLNKLKENKAKDIQSKKALIATFINAVYLYDDKLMIIFNHNNKPLEISIDKVKEVESVLLEEHTLRH